MNRTVLQIPLPAELRKEAEKQAIEQGFSSLQEAVRVFLKKLANGALGVRFEETVILSEKNAIRYGKMINEIESGLLKLSSARVSYSYSHF